MSVYLRQYGVAATIRFALRQADSNAFATNSHWTPATGDVKLSAGGGALADVTNLPTYANGQWSLSLTAGEMAANPLAVLIDDAAIIPESFVVETFGHASATYPTSYGDQWLGIATKIAADHGAGSYVDTGPGLDAAGVRGAVGLAAANLDTQLGAIPTVAPLDATATEAAAAAALVAYDVATAWDLSGLLTQTQFNGALPANFGVLSIDTSGNVSTTGGGSSGATAQEVWEYSTRTLTESDALTPEQATWLEETHAKAMLIGTGGAFVEVINPVGPGGKITLYSGYDYTSATTPISLPGATVDDGTAVTLHAVPDRYGDEGEAIDLTGAVAGGEYVLEASRSQIPVSRAGQYRYQVWADDGGDHALLAAGTLVVARGK